MAGVVGGNVNGARQGVNGSIKVALRRQGPTVPEVRRGVKRINPYGRRIVLGGGGGVAQRQVNVGARDERRQQLGRQFHSPCGHGQGALQVAGELVRERHSHQWPWVVRHGLGRGFEDFPSFLQITGPKERQRTLQVGLDGHWRCGRARSAWWWDEVRRRRNHRADCRGRRDTSDGAAGPQVHGREPRRRNRSRSRRHGRRRFSYGRGSRSWRRGDWRRGDRGRLRGRLAAGQRGDCQGRPREYRPKDPECEPCAHRPSSGHDGAGKPIATANSS